MFQFLNAKCESAFLAKRNPRQINWTVLYRRKHKKGQSVSNGLYLYVCVPLHTDGVLLLYYKANIRFKQLLFGADIWLIVNLVTFAVYAYMMVLVVVVFY